MALLSRPFTAGKIVGTAYTFEHAGDIFPTHIHGESDIHITIVAHGSVRLTGRPEIEGQVIEAKSGGTIVDWEPHQAHGFVALTDGATLINILKSAP